MLLVAVVSRIVVIVVVPVVVRALVPALPFFVALYLHCELICVRGIETTHAVPFSFPAFAVVTILAVVPPTVLVITAIIPRAFSIIPFSIVGHDWNRKVCVAS